MKEKKTMGEKKKKERAKEQEKKVDKQRNF